MKIAFVNQPLDGVLPPIQNSIGTWTYQVARRLARSWDVIIYVGCPGFQTRVIRDHGVQYRLIPMGPDKYLIKLLQPFSWLRTYTRPLFASRLHYLNYILQVAKDLKAQQCDIVHTFNYSQFIPIIRAFNPKAKIVLHMQCEWLNQLDRVMIARRLNNVDFIIGCSEYITDKLRTRFPRFSKRCGTVFNGVDVNYFFGKNRDTTSKKNDAARRLLYVGRISPEKGVHILLDAFQKMVHDYPELELEIIGPQWVAPIEFIVALSNDPKVSDLAPFHGGGYLSYLRERLPPDFVDRVAFSGSLPHADLKDHYLESDVFVQPSFSDAFPFTVVEAMASGLPVVASRVGGIPEAVAEGKTGLLVEPADTPGLAGAVVRLVMDQDLRETMGKAARQRAIEVFSWERIVDSLLCQYSNICEALR